MASSVERLARNEAAFRAANERIGEVAEELEVAPFLCECADETCSTVVQLALEEYREIRSKPRHFLVAPGHERKSVETWANVVSREGRYVVVEKVGEAGALAEELTEEET